MFKTVTDTLIPSTEDVVKRQFNKKKKKTESIEIMYIDKKDMNTKCIHVWNNVLRDLTSLCYRHFLNS